MDGYAGSSGTFVNQRGSVGYEDIKGTVAFYDSQPFVRDNNSIAARGSV